MIYYVRSLTIKQGKGQEAFQWAVKIATWINANYPDLNVQVLRNVSGPRWQIHWVSSYESLELWGERVAKISADPRYQEVISGAEELVVQSSWEDTLYETVE
jgi:hypothetical protein